MAESKTGSGAERLTKLQGKTDRFLAETAIAPSEDMNSGPLVRLLEISRAMNRIHEWDQLLAYVTERLRELFNASNGFVVLFDEKGVPRVQASRGGDEGQDALPLSETILRKVRTSRKPILIDNTAEIEELKNQSSIERYRIASVLCAPMVVNDEVIGALQFDHRGDPHPFPHEDLRLLELFADQAGTAFNNIQLIERLNTARHKVEVAQERVVQAERLSALGEMAAGMAHDFNNTLFVALGFCDVLLARDSLESDVRGSIERIRTCSLDAANTVRRLQSFARGGVAETRGEVVDCRAILAEMPEYTRHKWASVARRRGVQIEFRLALNPTPPVAANPADIREVLTNLIFNAVDALEETGGVIELSSSVLGGAVLMAVKDNGTGMNAETKRRVFEPFYTTKGARGSGFGLSVCWSIARRMGGHLDVESELDEYSQFTLTLPIVDEPAKKCEEGEPVPEAAARILVLDDEQDVLETITRMVRSLGHEVEAFSRPDDALRWLETSACDLILTDLDLGVASCNGFELARRVVAKQSGLDVVVLTGWGSDGTSEPRPDNVKAVLTKPITRERLRASIARVLTNG